MLATSDPITGENVHEVTFPKWVTKKFDGIRCMTDADEHTQQILPISRKLIPLPNCHIQQWALDLFAGMDGEIVVPGWTFNQIQSKVMSNATLDFPFKYMVFDHWDSEGELGYLQRLQKLEKRMRRYRCPRSELVVPVRVDNIIELERQFNAATQQGYEGLIVRDGDAPYKLGRATWNEQWMLKMKKFQDGEAEVIGFGEAEENRNPAEQDKLGKTKRSSHKAGKEPKGELGALLAYNEEWRSFRVSPGCMTKEERIEVWENRSKYLNRKFTYTFHAHGIKEKPRSAQFKCWVD